MFVATDSQAVVDQFSAWQSSRGSGVQDVRMVFDRCGGKGRGKNQEERVTQPLSLVLLY